MANAVPPTPRVWGLLGQRRGDNQQVVALGAALGGSFVPKRLQYAWPSLLPNLLRGRRGIGIRVDPDTPIAPPWPDFVIAVGRRSAPLALAIRHAAGGRCRLVQLGRPGAPLAWFDLVVTTPQYQLPPAANVVEIPLPFAGPATRTATNVTGHASTPTQPGIHLVLVGGPTAELEFDVAIARALAERALREADADGARLMVVTSPRTPEPVAAALADSVPPPHDVHVWRPGAPNPYATLLAAADQIAVTADSVSMLADACRTRARVAVLPLPERSAPLRRLVRGGGNATARALRRGDPLSRLLALPVSTGLVPAPRRYAAVHEALAARGLLECGAEERRAAIAAWEADVVARVRSLCRPDPGGVDNGDVD